MNYYRLLILLGMMLGLSLYSYSTTSFTYEGLNYEVISEEDFTCRVASTPSASGNINVPQCVYDGNVQYTVTEIGENAFKDNEAIAEVRLPSSVTTLERKCFMGCSSLEKINLPSSVSLIQDAAFSGCTTLRSIAIPDAVRELGFGVFGDCSSLSSVSLGQGLHSIGYSCFENCTSLTELTCPEGLDTIQSYAFDNCTALAIVNLPSTLKTIGYGVFNKCTSLSRINIAEGNAYYSSINGVLFNADKSELILCPQSFRGGFTCPDKTLSIAAEAFSGCSGLSSINLGKVTAINDKAFLNCTSLTEVIIPETVVSYGAYIFYGCSNLKSATLPSNLTDLPDCIFANCSSLA